jgi:hypothetical protein
MKKTITERMAAAAKKAAEGDERLWRHPLAEATVSLLTKGVPVTVDNLIAELGMLGDDVAAELKRPSSEEAIKRLRKIVAK